MQKTVARLLGRFSSIALLLLILTVAALGQVVPDYYIVQLLQEPASKTADAGRAALVESSQHQVRAMLESQQMEVVESVTRVANALVVHAPPGTDPQLQLARLQALPGVVRAQPVRLLKLHLNAALPLQAVSDAWALVGGIGEAGQGIKIGIIDTGIDASHPGFQDPTLPTPPGFPKLNQESDRVYTNNKVIVARSYSLDSATTVTAKDEEGHGTSVAFVAAGRQVQGPLGTLSGVAPHAWLGSYKVFPDRDSGAPDALILRALDDAVADGMDVVNLSLGSDLSDLPENDILDQAVERTVSAGIVVSVSSGNSGPDPNTIGAPASTPSAITVGNLANAHIFGASVVVSGLRLFAVPGSRSRNGTSVTGPLKDLATLDPSGLACSTLPEGSLSGTVALIFRGTCLFEQKLGNARQAGAVGAIVYTTEAEPDPFEMSVGAETLPATMVSNSTGKSLKSLASAGSPTVTLDFSRREVAASPNRISASSSRGPSVDASIKPEVLAVGASVYTATSGGSYTVISGTSFSSPMVAGSAAVLKAGRPGLTAAQYRSLLINSARPVYTNAVIPLGNQAEGAGALNLLAAMKAAAAINPATLTFGLAGSPAAVSQITITNLEKEADTFTLQAVPQNGPAPTLSDSVFQLDGGQSKIVNVSWNVQGLSAGEYQGIIRVLADRSIVMERVPYWFGVPAEQVARITVLDPPDTVKPAAEFTTFVRLTDEAGIPVTAVTPVVTTTAVGASVLEVTRVRDLTGTFLLRAKTGTESIEEFNIEAAGNTKTLSVSVAP